MDISKYEKNDDLICTTAFDMTQTTEAGGELTMPDYYPEIRRVVSVTADALPDSKYISDNNLEVGGSLAFTMLYIGDDGGLTSVPYVTEYGHKMAMGQDFAGGSADIRTESVAESVSCRPLGPRTVSLRAKVKSRAFAHKKEECTLKCESEGSGTLSSSERRTIERLESEVPTVLCRGFSVTGSVGGEILGYLGAKPVLCRGSIIIKEAVPGNDSVNIKGELLISCLILSDEGIYKTLYHSIPIEERIAAEGTTAECVCAAYGRAASVTVSAQEDGTLSIDGEYDIDAVTARTAGVTVTDDIYSTRHALEMSRTDIRALSLVCLKNGTVSVSGEGRRKSERGEGDCVISQSAEAKAERADIKDGTVSFTGSVSFKVLIASGGEVITEEFSAPFAFECPVVDTSPEGELIWHAHLSPGRTECRLEDGKLVCRCELSVYGEALKETGRSPVTAATVGAKDVPEDDGCVVRIRYPEAGKRIWDIAKECRASLGECERANRVSRRDLSDGTPLIVK